MGKYPRQEARDAKLLSGAGCAAMFAPTAAEMYPDGFVTTVSVGSPATGGPSQGLEGDFRPQMFGGVAVVVAKLLNQAQADVAVFGEKDYQQLMVVRRMALDLDIPTQIVGSPTERDGHGLALSSRNAYLSETELELARRLNGVLAEAGRAAARRPPDRRREERLQPLAQGRLRPRGLCRRSPDRVSGAVRQWGSRRPCPYPRSRLAGRDPG